MMRKSIQTLCFVLLSGLIISACKKDVKDFYPSVNPEFYIPIASGKITIKDKIEEQVDDSLLEEDPQTKLYKFVIRQDIPTPGGITDQIPDINVAQTDYKYTFNPPTLADINASTGFAFTDLAASTPLAGASGNSVPIPATTLTPLTNDVAINDIKYVTLKSGLLTIDMRNTMPFDVDVQFTVRDSLGNIVFTKLYDLSRKNGGTDFQRDTEDMSGKIITNPLKASVQTSVPGGQANADFSSGSGGVEVDFTLTNLVAQSGVAKLDVDNADNKVDKNERIKVGGLDKGILFKDVKLKSGQLNYSINNISSISPNLEFKASLLGMTDNNGTAVVLGKTSNVYELNDFRILFNNDSINPINVSDPLNVDTNAVRLNVLARFVPDNEGFIEFNLGANGVQIDVSTSIDNAKFLRADGYLGSQTFTNTDTVQAISDLALLSNISPGAIEFDGVELNLNFSNSLGFDVVFDSKIDAISQFGTAYNVSNTFSNVLEKGSENASQTAAVPVQRSIQLDKAKFTELINAIPSQLFTDFTITTNKGVTPDVNAGNLLYDNSSISGNLEVIAPLSLFLNNLTFTDTMKNSYGSTDSTGSNNIEEYVEDAKGNLQFIISNYFPMSLKLSVVSVDSLGNFSPVDTLLLNSSVISGATPEADGKVITPVINKFNIPVTFDSYKKLKDATHFIVTANIITEDAAGTKTPLKLFSDSFIEYRMVADLSIKVNKNE
jgi:hypothetical protein